MMIVSLFVALAAQVNAVPTTVEAIGPKQDDPRACTADLNGKPGSSPIVVQGGIIVQGGLRPQSGAEQIGPKQDDPRSPAQARPGDDNDPKATGGSSGGTSLSGRKLAIGPKQDDPRARAMKVARPGDDTDPQAKEMCMPAR
ncbi:MAG: hypothetical protein ACJ8EY_07570 [Sphingomicrobium sp.]